MIEPRAICRHCRQRAVNRPRGLCWTCFYTPGLKELYPSTSKYAHRGHGAGLNGNMSLPEPTAAPPGTPEKLVVLERRAANGEAIFHPLDARYAGDTRYAEAKRREGMHYAARAS